MTTKTLIRTSAWDWDRARAHLRDRATGVTAHVGGHEVRVSPEPLLRREPSGALLQSIRIDVGVPVTSVSARTEAGDALPTTLLTTPSSVRVLVPEPTARRTLVLGLPELSSSDTVTVVVDPPRHWDIHLVHHSHLDIGYTDPQGRVLAEHVSYLDSVLDLVEQTDDWEQDARFRWAVESLWSFEQWAAVRPRALVDRFVERVREQRIELTAMPFNLHTETCSTDELHELLRAATETGRRYGLRIPCAMQTDVPGAVGGLVDALADHDVRYLSVAHNWAGRSVPHLTGGQDVPRLFWWASPAGKRVLVWVTDTPHGLAYMEGPLLGFDTSFRMVEDLLPAYLTSLATHPYPYDGTVFGFAVPDVPLHHEPYRWDVLHLRVQGHFGDNAPPRRIISETVRRWNEQWAFPHLRVSRNEDFFTEAERRFGDRVPTFTGDWNNWWADGIGSGARALQLARRAQRTVADAQTVNALAAVRAAAGAEEDTRLAGAVYANTSLFDEHTWGAADPWTHGDDHTHSGIEQWTWKYHTAIAAHDDANTLMDKASARLAGVLDADPRSLLCVHVVNPASSRRSGVVTAFVPESRVPLAVALAVTDARTGTVLPTEQTAQVNLTHRAAGRFLHIAVDDVPALGTVRLDLSAAEVAEVADVAESAGSAPEVLENEHLRVEVDLRSASIRSVYDKRLRRELVAADPTFGFNAYVYDHYGSAGGINHQSSRTTDDGSLGLLGTRSLARPAAVVDAGATGVRRWLTYETVAPGADWVRTTLSLEHGTGRLDIANRVAKPGTMAKESAYFAFPFAADEAVVRWDATGAVAGTDLPRVPGGAAHMRAVRHWVALHAGDTAISWVTQDAALLEVGDIALPYAPFPPSTPRTEPHTLYSWIHNNLWDTNFPSQQAFELTFRYSVAAAAAATPDDACAFAVRTSASTVHRLVSVVVPANGPAVSGVPAGWRIGDDRVHVVGLTVPAAGKVLVRLQSVATQHLEVTLDVPTAVTRAWSAGYLGVAGDPVAVTGSRVSVRIGALGTAAVLLDLAP